MRVCLLQEMIREILATIRSEFSSSCLWSLQYSYRKINVTYNLKVSHHHNIFDCWLTHTKCMCIDDLFAHQILQRLMHFVFHLSSLIPKGPQGVLLYFTLASSSIWGEIIRINHDVGMHSYSIRFVPFLMKINQLIQKLNLTNTLVRAHTTWFSKIPAFFSFYERQETTN